MADKGESEVYSGVSKLQHTIEESVRKIDELLVSAKSSRCGAEMKALLIEIKVQKHNQERVKKRFDQFMTEFCQSHNHQSPEVFVSSDKEFEELKETVEGFEKEEDDMKERIDQLMVKFGKSRDSVDSDVWVWTAVGGGQEKSKDESHFMDMGIKGTKIQEEFYKEPGSPSDSTDVDSEFWRSKGLVVQHGYVDKKMNELPPKFEGQEQDTSVVMSGFEEIEADVDMTKVMGLEGKMQALMEATEILLKKYKDQDVERKSLMKWLRDYEAPGKEWITLNEMKDRAVELGADVCRMLGDLMFRLSEREEMLARFHEFKSALQSLTDNSFMVTRKLICALEIADEEIRKRDKVRLTKNKSKAGSSAAEKQIDISEEKIPKKSNSEESQIDQLLLQIYHQVYRLDLMLINPGLPESKVLPPPKKDLKQYEKTLKGIDKEVKKLKNKSCSITSIFGSEVLKFESFWRRVVEMKINDLWSGMEV
ncbi:hypothetical protein Ddye_024487 [Dipteronia dyeriana]|uniref:Uncharacterized protein n=1 Tax=Dipteronia dyeriana TaxID=168575 RepID=A0AAD9TVV9_9ROSI|nr:hypothetical protein Ddye_024487 [Dipteronia dyeriana]